MPIPTAVPLVTVTGQAYGTDTSPRVGRIIFSLQQILQDATDKVTFPPYNAIAILGSTNMVVVGGVAVSGTTPIGPGQFSIVLIATDYANETPPPSGTQWYYRTTFDLDGSSPYTTGYLIPHTPSPVDISQLSQVPVN